jgi:galactose mutarotase-like enzyme
MAKAKAIEVEEENVLIEAGSCAVTILPQLGGKIASIRVRDRELLQTPLAPYGPRTHAMAFDAADASGWDECLPSVAPCTVNTAAGPAQVPDHGDLWRVAWTEVRDQGSGVRDRLTEVRNGQSLTLRGECFSLPLVLERTVSLTESEKGWQIRLLYKVTNMGDSPIPWSWSAHPLFAAETGDRVVLPSTIETLRLEGSGRGRLGAGGDSVSWPIALLADGSPTDLSLAQPPESEIGDKLFTGRLNETENWCALERPNAGVRIVVSFDPAATPYLGLWICHGGWPDRPGPRQTCIALEPSTAPVDSLAIEGPWSRKLYSHESYFWQMTVAIENV